MIWNFGEQEKPVWGHLCFQGYGYHCLSRKIFGQNYRFSGQTSQVIKLSIKSKKNNNVNVSSKKTSFRDKDGEKCFRELPVFGQREDHRPQWDMPALE